MLNSLVLRPWSLAYVCLFVEGGAGLGVSQWGLSMGFVNGVCQGRFSWGEGSDGRTLSSRTSSSEYECAVPDCRPMCSRFFSGAGWRFYLLSDGFCRGRFPCEESCGISPFVSRSVGWLKKKLIRYVNNSFVFCPGLRPICAFGEGSVGDLWMGCVCQGPFSLGEGSDGTRLKNLGNRLGVLRARSSCLFAWRG